jgi:hypothetical protein
MKKTIKLYRPVGKRELELIAERKLFMAKNMKARHSSV